MQTKTSVTRRWLAFAVLLVGAFLPPLDFFIVNVALPSIQGSLGTSAAELQLVISGYAAAYAVFLITGGRLGDLFGRRRIFLIGISGFGITSVVCGLATSPSMLIVGRVLQGLSAAAMAPQGLASIHALFPVHERSRALGLYGATVGLAAVVAQTLGGALISADILHLEWRIIFLINLPVVAAVLIGGKASPKPSPVNPAGEGVLTRSQAWKGLMLKARDARQFLPPGLCTKCDVVEESASHFVRDATIAGADLREIITLESESKVTFFQVSGPREGAIINELFEDEAGALQLRFYGYFGLRGKKPGGPEELAEQAFMDGEKGYKAALLSTLKRTRDLIATGKL